MRPHHGVALRPALRAFGPKVRTLNTSKIKPSEKRADPFYSSAEYLAWRKIVIERAHRRCQDPLCRTPHRTGIRLFADHIKELRDGGAPLDPANGLARCGSCHTRKTAQARARRLASPTP